jgi:hypothetical protein
MHISENMKVIFDTINTIQVAILVFYYSCNIGIKLIGMILVNCWLTIFCSDNNVIDVLTVT